MKENAGETIEPPNRRPRRLAPNRASRYGTGRRVELPFGSISDAPNAAASGA